jgi:hypothetical protein
VDELQAVLPMTHDYNAAGILPYRVEGGKVYVLLSVEHRKDKGHSNATQPRDCLCIIGGPKATGGANNSFQAATQPTDANYIMTAIRFLHEKTAHLLPDATLQGMMQSCANNTTDTQASFYFAKGRYVLIVYPLSHDLQIDQSFAAVSASVMLLHSLTIPTVRSTDNRTEITCCSTHPRHFIGSPSKTSTATARTNPTS